MSESVGSINLDLEIGYNEFQRQMNGIAGNATNIVGGAFSKLGGIIAAAFATKGLIDFGREAINLASDLQEVQNVVDVTFKDMAGYVNNWSQTALKQFGLSELSAKRYSSVLGAIMKSSGLASDQIAHMSTELAGLTGDFASFYNLETDEAFEKIRSGITGETEPLLSLGIDMRVAALEAYALSKGIDKSVSSMSTAEQTLLRYNYLLDRSKDAQGDFARTSYSWANQTRLLSEQWKIFQGTMGRGFINILTPVVKWINMIIAKLQTAAKYFVAFTELIFGDASGGSGGGATGALEGVGGAAGGAADSIGDVGDAASKTGKETKKAGKEIKGALSSFDQLNVIGRDAASSLDDAADGLGDAGGGISGPIDLGEISEPDLTGLKPFEDWLNNLKTSAAEVGSFLRDAFGPSIKSAIELVNPELEAWGQTLSSTFDWLKSLGEPLAEWFRTGFVDAFNASVETLGVLAATALDVARHLFEGLVTIAKPIIEWFVTDGLPTITTWFVEEFNPMMRDAIVTFGGILKGIIDSGVMVFSDLVNALLPILDWLVKDGLSLVTNLATQAVDLIDTMFWSIKEIFDKLWSEGVKPGLDLVSNVIVDTLQIIKASWDKWGDDIVTGLQNAITNIKDILLAIWDSTLGPIWNNLLNNLTWLWNKHLKGLVEQLTETVGKLADGALEIWNKFISPIVKWLVETFGPTFAQAFNTVIDITASVVGAIVDFTKGMLKALGGVIDFIVGVFTGDWKKAWNGVKDIFKGIFDAFGGIIKGAMNVVISVINNAIRSLNRVKIDVPDWVQELTGMGDSFGINIPLIPKLAKGGIVSGPTLAMVGDNRNANVDPEVVTPLSKLSDMLSVSNQSVVEVLVMILNALENLDLSMEIDGEKLTRVVRNRLNSENGRIGSNMITVGGVPLK